MKTNKKTKLELRETNLTHFCMHFLYMQRCDKIEREREKKRNQKSSSIGDDYTYYEKKATLQKKVRITHAK